MVRPPEPGITESPCGAVARTVRRAVVDGSRIAIRPVKGMIPGSGSSVVAVPAGRGVLEIAEPA